MLGYEPEELVGRSYRSVVHLDDRGVGPIDTATDASNETRFENRCLRKDGGIVWVEWRVVDLANEGTLYCVARDITERRKAEERLRRAEEKYRGIFENAVEGIFRTLPDGRLVESNPALRRMFGYGSPEEMRSAVHDVGKQLWVDPTERERFLRAVRERDTVSGYEARMRRKDGSVIWVSISSRAT